jgi:hypothetical protein
MSTMTMNRETRIAALLELGPVGPELWTWEEFEQVSATQPHMALLGPFGWRDDQQDFDYQEFSEGERARGRDVWMNIYSAPESALARAQVSRYGYQPFDPTRSKSWKLGWLEEDAAQDGASTKVRTETGNKNESK